MTDQNHPDPLGGPTPLTPEEIKRLNRSRAREEAQAAAEAVWDKPPSIIPSFSPISWVVGGVVVFGFFSMMQVGTVQGATRSAKLRWQACQNEANQAVAAAQSGPAEANRVVASAGPPPAPSAR
jgi:hypothetical protein